MQGETDSGTKVVLTSVAWLREKVGEKEKRLGVVISSCALVISDVVKHEADVSRFLEELEMDNMVAANLLFPLKKKCSG
ncbi:hypothetical protein MRX96_055464 [Rhipicephalus microplus]